MALASMLALIAFLGLTSSAQASGLIPLPDVTVTVPRLITITAPAVTLPPRTVTVPATAVTRYVSGPTITKSKVVVKQQPGRTVTVTKTMTPNAAPTTSVKPAPGPSATIPTTTVTVTSPPKTVTKENRIILTVPKAVSISVGLVLLGVLLFLLIQAIVYATGYRDSEKAQAKAVRSEVKNIFRK